MKIRLDAGDGRALRFRLINEETGQKIGQVEKAFLGVDLFKSTLQFWYRDPATNELRDSGVLRGTFSNGFRDFFFEN